MVRKREKQERIKTQIKEMEKKLNIYRHYKDDFGVSLTKEERHKVVKQYN